MTAIFDVIVVGAGAVGAACARELAVGGRRVLVLDRGTPDGEAWRAAAGMLAPQIEAIPSDPLFDLGLAGRERYTMLAPVLLSSTGIDISTNPPPPTCACPCRGSASRATIATGSMPMK